MVLDDVPQLLLIEHGAVDLFAVRMEDGRPIGRWSFLSRVEKGALILGSPLGPRHTIIGRPVPGAYLSLLPVDRLHGLSVTDTAAARAVRELPTSEYAVAVQQFLQGIEAGIVGLARALREQLPPQDFIPLEASGRTTIPAGAAARSVDGVRWVLVRRAASGSVTASTARSCPARSPASPNGTGLSPRKKRWYGPNPVGNCSPRARCGTAS